ncbi:GNAT family N-acetyltransferase [Clostridium beijerinckii]|uniref:GNAT family N-acetyltransferase n=1 Tax=Clostridium beijerinckii TaxID=1520 RepID=UPI0002FD802F|nr:GNAT family N-acetyltransferase [Clostridium beijerinckii]
MEDNIELKKIDDDFAIQISEILNNDEKLQAELGTISLSHQNLKESKAQVGYWIRSDYWKKGYTSGAFSQILNYAKRKGIKYLSAKINEENIDSKRIWEKYNADIKIVDNRFYANIILPDIDG